MPTKVRPVPVAKGYSEGGASYTRRALKGMTAQSGSPREDIDYNNMTLRQRCRMIYMTTPLATSAIDTNVTKIVGPGLEMQAHIDSTVLGLSPEAAEIWKRRTQAEFAVWCTDCDATGMNSFADLQALAQLSWLLSGDVFCIFQQATPNWLNPYALRLRMVEADRVSTPMDKARNFYSGFTDGMNGQNPIYDGVELESGRVSAYYIRNTYPGEHSDLETKWERISARGARTGLPNLLHLMRPERPDQYRGVPYLAKVVESLLQLRRYTDAQLMAAVVQSFFTAWIKTNTDSSVNPINEVGPGNPLEYDGVSKSPNEYAMGSGTVINLKEGESVDLGNPNIPTSGFQEFVTVFAQNIGAALGEPYEVLVKRFNASYSASRAALMEAWEGFAQLRSILVRRFCQPVYERWLTEAVARGRVQAPGFLSDPIARAAWSGAKWVGPIQGQLDPLKEAKAAEIRVAHAWTTNAQVTQEMGGGDFRANAETIQIEQDMLPQESDGGN